MRLRDGKYIFDCVDAVVVFDDIEHFQYTYNHGRIMEDGGVDRTVTDCPQLFVLCVKL